MSSNIATKRDILTEVDCIVKTLSGPLDQSEKNFGWNEDIRITWLKFFLRLQSILNQNTEIPPEFSSIIRGLDSFGIMDGELFNRAIHISCMVREFKKQQQRIKRFRLIFPTVLLFLITILLLLLPDKPSMPLKQADLFWWAYLICGILFFSISLWLYIATVKTYRTVFEIALATLILVMINYSVLSAILSALCRFSLSNLHVNTL